MMNTELAKLLGQDFTLITSTNRLGHYLKNQYAALQIEQGYIAWKTPDIMPWSAWLSSLWEEYAVTNTSAQLLLSSCQLQTIWHQLITESQYADQLLQPVSAAKQALVAWDLCQQWQIPIFPDNVYINNDSYAFQVWAKAYVKRCQSNGWLDEASLASQLTHNIQSTSIKYVKKIALIGFDVLTPQQRLLLDALINAGCIVHEHPFNNRNRRVTARGFPDGREEIKTAANWARNLLESDPAGKIGIVIPNLQAMHSQLINTFDDVLLPGSLTEPPESIQRPYSISHGLPLIRYPLINTALLILRLGDQPLPLTDIGSLLNTVFIGSTNEEQINQAKLGACLLERGEHQLSINDLLYIGSNYMEPGDRPNQFLACCHRYQEVFRRAPKIQSAHHWATTFADLLKVFKWPGERQLDSAEYQTVETWHDVFSQFASLDIVSSSLSYSAALTHVSQLASESSFQPETPEVQIHISGMKGVAGMEFDYLWVMGLHDEVWPAPAVPNPFIPITLQREAQLPNATAEVNLTYARLMTEYIVASAADVVLSYPQNEKERPLRASPMIKPYLETTEIKSMSVKSGYAPHLLATEQIETISDTRAPAISAGQIVGGGTGLFKDQAACPFRAFARHRLYAYGLNSVDIGLDAMDRGSLVHHVMQLLWQQLNGYEGLLSRDETELNTLIDSVIDVALKKYRQWCPQTFTRRFTNLEKQRLNSLIHEWLDVERKRQTFTVFACEQKQVFSYEGIEVSIRIDRIDQLTDGRYVIIDYKTGTTSLKSWFDERPDEPQLPLYAVTNPGEIAALVFAKVKRGEASCVGLADGEGIIPDIKTINNTPYTREIDDWQTLFTRWKIILTQLAIDFREGEAQVDPKDANTCRYCDMHIFCRIDEKTTE
jgi:probable DNA repair protein